jgi:hypothetical protein
MLTDYSLEEKNMEMSGVLILGGCLLLSVTPSFAKDVWHFKAVADEMTDRTTCRVDGPSKKIVLSLQNQNFYVISASPISVEEVGIMTVRVDKSPARDVTLRMINPNLAAFIPAGDLLNEMKRGTAMRVRLLVLKGLEEDSATMDGFNTAFGRYQACMAR